MARHFRSNDHHVDLWRRRTRPKDAHVALRAKRLKPKDLHVRRWTRLRAAPKDLHVRLYDRRNAQAFSDRFVSDDPDPRARLQAAEAFADHVLAEAPTRAFRFACPDPERPGSFRSAYWFNLCWTPGSVSLSGDVGELTLTHYHALGSFREGMEWLARGDVEYLLGKSGVRTEWDRDATFRRLVQDANEEAFAAVREATKEARRYRADLAEAGREHASAVAAWKREKAAHVASRATEFAAAHAEWAGDEDSRPEDEPDWAAFLGDAPEPPERDDPDPDGYDMRLKVVERDAAYGRGRESRWEAPEGFRRWLAIWDVIGHGEPDVILNAEGRADLREGLRNHLADCGPETCADLCARLGYEDWYGAYDLPRHARFQVRAMVHGASLVLASEREAVPA